MGGEALARSVSAVDRAWIPGRRQWVGFARAAKGSEPWAVEVADAVVVVEGPAGTVEAFEVEIDPSDAQVDVAKVDFDWYRLWARMPGAVEARAWGEAAQRRGLTWLTGRVAPPGSPEGGVVIRSGGRTSDWIPDPRLEEILEWARECGPVLPLVHRGKAPLTRHGVRGASRDPAKIRRWWRHNPQCNWGLATGHGTMVADVDGQPGEATLGHLQALPEGCPEVITGRVQGRHLYFRGVGPGKKLGPGLEVLGLGNYVVLPGGRHPNGAVYRWARPRPDWATVPPVPEFMAAPARPPEVGATERETMDPAGGHGVLDRACHRLGQVIEGARNDQLNVEAFTLAGLHAAGRGPGREDCEESLVEACRTNGLVADIGERRCRRTMASGWRTGLTRPLPLVQNPGETEAVAEVQAAMETARWPRASGAIDRRVLAVIAALAALLGRVEVRMSHRQVSEGCMIVRRTVTSAIHRLEAAGWLAVVEVGHGRRGSLLRLRLPEDICGPIRPTTGVGVGPWAIPSGHDAWAGLPVMAPGVLRCVAGGSVPTRDLADVVGVTPRQALRVLHSLGQVGLVVPDQGRWCLTDLSRVDMTAALDSAATTLGVTGAQAKMVECHRVQRAEYLLRWDTRRPKCRVSHRPPAIRSRPRSEPVPESVSTTPVGSRGPP